ncbi:MAG: O-antigen ligase family protein [Bryobacteraceae bacterium]|jgi:hypothetical protein
MTPAITFEERARPGAWLSVAPFALCLLVVSFLPDTLTPKPVIFDIPVRGAELIVLFAALASFAGWLCTSDFSAARPRWHMNIPMWFSLILAYAAASTLWSQMDLYNTRGMFYGLCFAAAAFVLPFSVIASLTPGQIRSLTRMIALGLAVASAVYFAVSYFDPGVRTELGHFYTSGFGIERLKGPLYAPSTGHMVLLPAAAVLLQDWFDDVPGHGFANAAGLASLSISIIALGSRFALIVTALFIVAIAVTARGERSRRIAAAAALGVALSAGAVFQYASTERLQSFDSERAATYTTALNIVEQRDPVASLRGSGYGSVWPWYMLDWELGDRVLTGHGTVSSDYGPTLFQPHSVFLLLAVELGALGVLFFAKLWIVLWRLVSRAVSRQENSIAAIGVACATLGMLADTIVFMHPKVSTVWWFFLLAALALRGPDPLRERFS